MSAITSETTENHWKSLYRLGGITTILMMALFLFDVIGYLIYQPYPNSGKAWIELLRNNHFVGVLLLSFPTYLGTILYLLTYLCLYNILLNVNIVFSKLATLLAIIGSTILLLSHMGYPILYIYNQYEAATQEAHRASLIIAIDTRLISSATGINLSGFFSEGALVIFSIIMFKSSVFSKGVAILGIVGHGLDFLRILMNLVFIPESISAILLMIGGLPQLLWLILVGVKLIQLGARKEIRTGN